MKREVLQKLGLTDEQIEGVMKEHGKSVTLAKSDAVKVEKELAESLKNDLEEARKTIKKLEKTGADNEALQKEIEAYKAKYEESEAQRKADTVNRKVIDAIREAGGKDTDYIKFKLGELETDKDGNIKDLENKIKEFKENNPQHFESEQSKDDDVEWLDNSLGEGEKANEFAQMESEFVKHLGIE